MNARSRKFLQVALISLLASPLTLLAAGKTADDQYRHHSHHRAPAQSATTSENAAQDGLRQIQENMQARMLAMQNTSDPEARQAMMMAQMADMSAVMAGSGSGCPMAQGMMGNPHGGMIGHSMGGMMGDHMHGNLQK